MTYCEFMKLTEEYWKDKLKDLRMLKKKVRDKNGKI